jgi:uncharacterized membrane protein
LASHRIDVAAWREMLSRWRLTQVIYVGLKTLHGLSAAVLFGIGMGITFFHFAAWRSKDVAGFAHVACLTVIADWLFTATAIVIQPVSDVILIHIAGYLWDAPWLLWSYALYLVAGLFWLPVVWMHLRIAKRAAEARDDNRPLPIEVHQLMRIWFWCGWPAYAAVVAS